MDWLGLIALSATSAALAGFGGRQLWRVGFSGGSLDTDPDRLALPPFRPLTPRAFVTPNDQGAFGEALTYIMMAAEGWRPVNGKPGTGPQGIDGIFVRQVEGAFEACLIETKTNASRYGARQMANTKLCEDLTRLYVTCGDPVLGALYARLYTGLTEGDPRNPSSPNGRYILPRNATFSVSYRF